MVSELELLFRIRNLEWEIEEAGYDDGPCEVISAWPTGMPHGTNERISALFQRSDIDEMLDELDELYTKLQSHAKGA